MRLITTCLVVFLSISLVVAQDDSDYQPDSNVFGIVEGMWFPELTCGLNPGWERLIFDWSAHQPESAEDWMPFLNIPDEWLWSANDCNREIVAVVKNTPAWATDGLPGAGVPRGLYLPIDDPDNVWASFMRRTAEYYASRGVHRFIIWNEPDIDRETYGFEFEGNLEDYYQMVRVAYLAAQEGNPDARIHLAGTTYWHDVNSGERLYTERLLERISQDEDAEQHNFYFDSLSLHIYFRADTVYDIVRIYRELLDQYGFEDKAIWITETNASPNLDPNWLVERPQFQITVEQQAAYIVQAVALGLAAGAERIAVYKLYDQLLPDGAESFGLLYPADATPRPAFYAYQTVIDHFNALTQAQLAQTETVNVVRLTHINDQQTFVAWNRTEDSQILEIEATTDKAYLIDQYGNTQIIRPQNGIFTLNLPEAICEEQEGCPVGGNVSIVVQPAGDSEISVVGSDDALIFE